MNAHVNLTCNPHQQLVGRLEATLRGERQALAQFLRALAELDEDKAYADLGYSSTFAFCVEKLNLSEDQAYRRVAVARAGRRFPRVLEMIASGRLHMSGAAKLAKHLTEENHETLLEEASGLSKAKIELLVATRFPEPAATTRIRPVPAPRREAAETAPSLSLGPAPAPAPKAEPPAPPPAPKPVAKGTVKPTSASTYTFRYTASARTKALLDKAKDLLAHQHPDADVGDIVEAALEAYVEKLEKKRFKTTDRPRTQPPKDEEAPPAMDESGRTSTPAAVRRFVYERDGGRCTFFGPDGHRCTSTRGLEIDHIQPAALGGSQHPDNLRLLCHTHNQHAAEKTFGRDKIEREIHTRRPRPASLTSPSGSHLALRPRPSGAARPADGGLA